VFEAHNLFEISLYQTHDDDNETRATRCDHDFAQRQKLEILEDMSAARSAGQAGRTGARARADLCAMCDLRSLQGFLLSDLGCAKARLPRHPGVTCKKLQDDSET
jgi:hypothetical protein